MNETVFPELLYNYIDKKTAVFIDAEGDTPFAIPSRFIKDKNGVYVLLNAMYWEGEIQLGGLCSFSTSKELISIDDAKKINLDIWEGMDRGTATFLIQLRNIGDADAFEKIPNVESSCEIQGDSCYYLRDNQHIYYFNSTTIPRLIKVKTTEPVKSFYALNDVFAKDTKYCFFMGKRISGADPRTFVRVRNKSNAHLDKYVYADSSCIYKNVNWARLEKTKKKLS